MDFAKSFKKVFVAFVVITSLIGLGMVLFGKNAYRDQREYEKYFRVPLAEGSRNLPNKGFNIGPKTVWTSYDEHESAVVFIGMNGDPGMSYTEVYFADGGRFLGYYQRLSTGSSYGDGFTPELGEYEEISAEDFFQHVPNIEEKDRSL